MTATDTRATGEVIDVAEGMVHLFHHRESDGTIVTCCGARLTGDGELDYSLSCDCVVCADPTTWVGWRLP